MLEVPDNPPIPMPLTLLDMPELPALLATPMLPLPHSIPAIQEVQVMQTAHQSPGTLTLPATLERCKGEFTASPREALRDSASHPFLTRLLPRKPPLSKPHPTLLPSTLDSLASVDAAHSVAK